MSREATRFIGDLPAGENRVIRGLAVVGEGGSGVDELAAAVDLPASEVEEAVAALARAGWITTVGQGRYTLTDQVVGGGSGDAGAAFDPQEVRRRFGQYLLDGVRAEPAAWLADHRSSLVTAVRIGSEHGMPELAAGLAAAVWEVAPDIADRQWWDDLAHWGEEAAIRWQNPPQLAALLAHSARFLRRAKDFRGAERQWVRALHIGRRIKDRTIAVPALESLSELYEVWGRRLHRKLDAEFELLSWHRRAGTDLEATRARVRIGSTMLAAGRARSAVEYLAEAEAELSAVGESVEREHADAMVELGRAHWQLGAVTSARRCFSHALATLVERDPAAAESVRGLLRTEANQPLPGQRDENGPPAVRSPVDE